MRTLWLALALTLVAVPARAEGWSIGSNFGLGILMPNHNGDNITSVGIPGSVGQLVPGFQPGLRFGFPFGRNEAFFDAGIATWTATGETISSYQFSANLQTSFTASASTAPYVTLGAGLLGESYPGGNSFSNATVGGGLGVAVPMAEGHGRLRAEMRLDYIAEDTQGFEGGTLFGIKFGFDLLMR